MTRSEIVEWRIGLAYYVFRWDLMACQRPFAKMELKHSIDDAEGVDTGLCRYGEKSELFRVSLELARRKTI